MRPILPVALLLFGIFPALADAEAPRTNATEAAEASLKAAQAEATRLETLRRSLSGWKTDADATAIALHDMNRAAMKLAMAATEDQNRWQQAQNGWRGEANAKMLAEQAIKFQRPPPDTGDADLKAASAALRERLEHARTAVADFNKAGLTGKPEQKRLMLDQCHALVTTLFSTAQASDTLRALLDTRLTDLDTQRLLLRGQSAALTRPTLPTPPGQKP